MAQVTGIGGVFFKARDPKALAQWYARHLGIELHPAFDGAVFAGAGATVWSVFAADSDYFGSAAQRHMVNYRVDDLDAMLARLRAAGVAVDDRVEEGEQGRFGWATDPEGNRFELWQPPAA